VAITEEVESLIIFLHKEKFHTEFGACCLWTNCLKI